VIGDASGVRGPIDSFSGGGLRVAGTTTYDRGREFRGTSGVRAGRKKTQIRTHDVEVRPRAPSRSARVGSTIEGCFHIARVVSNKPTAAKRDPPPNRTHAPPPNASLTACPNVKN
jgi:hypothetical protein